jgi:DNA polymerase-3 subunit beta
VLKTGVIIPRKGIQELKKVLEDNEGAAQVQVNEGFFTVQSGVVTLGVRLVDGQFPDYRQVIPADNQTRIEASKPELLAAVKRVSLVTTDKSRAIKFKLFDGTLTVSSSSPEYGEATESISVNQEGENITIGFSSRYVVDLLSAMQSAETVSIKLSGELGPAVFNGLDDELYTCIVMPMRFE